jgi:hypothetical protein
MLNSVGEEKYYLRVRGASSAADGRIGHKQPERDWRIDLAEAERRVGDKIALLAPVENARASVEAAKAGLKDAA